MNKCLHGCRTARETLDDILQHLPPGALGGESGAAALEARSARDGCKTRTAQAGDAGGGGVGAPPRGDSGLRAGEAPAESERLPVPMADIASAVVYGLQHELLRRPLRQGASERGQWPRSRHSQRCSRADTVASHLPRLTQWTLACSGPAGDVDRRRALDAWLTLLSRAMPGEPNRKSLARLAAATAGVQELDATRWSHLLQELPRPLLPLGAPSGGIAWAACRGFAPDARGYPCGMWSLMHTLLAHSPDVDAADALRAFVGYVAYFFGCDACARHFAALAASATDPVERVSGTSAAALWFWRAHNAVNLRLNRASPHLGAPSRAFRLARRPHRAAAPRCSARVPRATIDHASRATADHASLRHSTPHRRLAASVMVASQTRLSSPPAHRWQAPGRAQCFGSACASCSGPRVRSAQRVGARRGGGVRRRCSVTWALPTASRIRRATSAPLLGAARAPSRLTRPMWARPRRMTPQSATRRLALRCSGRGQAAPASACSLSSCAHAPPCHAAWPVVGRRRRCAPSTSTSGRTSTYRPAAPAADYASGH